MGGKRTEVHDENQRNSSVAAYRFARLGKTSNSRDQKTKSCNAVTPLPPFFFFQSSVKYYGLAVENSTKTLDIEPRVNKMNPSRLAQTLTQPATANSSTPSALWKQLVSTVPGLQNAAQFYLQDAQKLTRLALNAAGAPVSVEDADVNYQPHPDANSTTVSLKGVHLQVLSTGETLLLLIVPGGFAVFEILPDGVYEVAADLTADRSNLSAVSVGSVVGIRALTKQSFLILHEHALRLYDVGSSADATQHLGGASLDSSAQPVILFESPATALHLMRRHCVVCCPEFQQLFVVSIPPLVDSSNSSSGGGGFRSGAFAVQHVLINDGSADSHTLAASSRWLAYCSQFERAPTVFRSKTAAETALSSVARTVSGGIKLVCGITPGLAPQRDPSSAVTIFDVESNMAFASFSPHNGEIQCMAFDPSGTLLATASSDGTTVNVFQIGGREVSGEGSVTLLCRLNRGMTPQTITSLAFSPLSDFVALATTVGTVHVFCLGDDIASVRGTAFAKDFSAALLSSAFRIRALPTTIPVDPAVVFASYMAGNGGFSDHPTLVVASSTGVISVVAPSSQLVAAGGTALADHFPAATAANIPGSMKLIYSKFLDTFCAPIASRPSTESTGDLEQLGKGSGDHHDAWRSQVELVTAPPIEPLDNFRIPGLPQPSVDTAAEWEAV